MESVQAALLLTLVWTFSAVCQADDGFSISCDNVTGSVGKEVTFTCRVSQKCTDYCVRMYKFQYPERVNDSVIFKEELPKGSCDQRNIFTCSYTPTTAMTQQFRFFVQARCRPTSSDFTVTITDADDPGYKDTSLLTDLGSKDTSSKYAIAAAVSCLSIVLIIIIMTIICKTKPCGHDEENTTPPEDSALQDLI